MSYFLSYNQLLMHLRKKGLIVPTNGKPKRVLEKENCYSVINGYKTPFYFNDTKIFRPGTHFNDIYNLFLFDRELKQITLEFLLAFENELKSIISYCFSDFTKKDGTGAYLLFDKYDHKKIKDTNKLIHDIYAYLKNPKEDYINHYLLEKREVPPLWVLVNRFTFGDLSRFYKCMPKEIQLNVCKQLSSARAHEYGKDKVKHFGFNIYELEIALKIGCDFRNVCAHDGRLFNSHSRHSNKTFYIGHLLTKLKPYVNKFNYNKFKTGLLSLRTKYSNRFSDQYSVDDLFTRHMNFHSDWILKLQ